MTNRLVTYSEISGIFLFGKILQLGHFGVDFKEGKDCPEYWEYCKMGVEDEQTI
jgi:hypothetical protein